MGRDRSRKQVGKGEKRKAPRSRRPGGDSIADPFDDFSQVGRTRDIVKEEATGDRVSLLGVRRVFGFLVPVLAQSKDGVV